MKEGYFEHFFVVSKEGRFYGCVSNASGKLGLSQSVSNVTKFTKLSLLSGHKIDDAYAGYQHSLFQTSEGKILACGDNDVGQCFVGVEKKVESLIFP